MKDPKNGKTTVAVKFVNDSSAQRLLHTQSREEGTTVEKIDESRSSYLRNKGRPY